MLILTGSAFVEESEFGGTWTGRKVSAGEFFLATTPVPYELRWQVMGPEDLETLYTYLGLPLLSRACEDLLGVRAETLQLREMFGERDPFLSTLLDRLRDELIQRAFRARHRANPRRPPHAYLPGTRQSPGESGAVGCSHSGCAK